MRENAKNAVLNVRIDTAEKQAADKLFSKMGTSTSEAVRMFLAEAIAAQKMPFVPKSIEKSGKTSAFGLLHIYARQENMAKERDSWIDSLTYKHEERHVR
ncbi:MAG: type II toxin-antitoxin system RelB/DinJ family antitoxin [Coriobacteriales bacterium]|jgi:addiction module RelB/DinJ family antitoxin|nr:type II toxin-antitoxin system RelB/DinJ family antitoxin [Coriobacteriales bacterium]